MLRTRIDSKKYNAMIIFTDSGTTLFPHLLPEICHCQLSKTIVPNQKILKPKLPGYGHKKEVPDMADKRIMTPEEKALLQARHRQEEAEARNRKKERDARTHRLVQEGAILESIVPHIKEMDLDSLKRELIIRLRGM